MTATQDMESRVVDLSDALVFEVAKRWLTAGTDDQKKITTRIAGWLVENHADDLPWLDLRWGAKRQIDLTRYRVYRIVREAVRRGFVHLNPPEAVEVGRELLSRYDLDDKKFEIRVVNVAEDVNDMVARATADLAFQLFRRLAEQHAREAENAGLDPEKGAKPVSIGLGAGHSSLAVVTHLATLINAMPACPKLRLHALTATIQNPMISPVTFFRLFDEHKPIEYVDLPTAATVECSGYQDLQKQDDNIRRAFALRDEIELVVSSLGAADDEHGTIRQYLDSNKYGPSSISHRDIVGDLQYLPYHATGPIRLTPDIPGRRAVTLFDWENFEQYNRRPERFFVISAGPCRMCGSTKTPAIVPLLSHMRFWTHLVTDLHTARELLAPEASARLRKGT